MRVSWYLRLTSIHLRTYSPFGIHGSVAKLRGSEAVEAKTTYLISVQQESLSRQRQRSSSIYQEFPNLQCLLSNDQSQSPS